MLPSASFNNEDKNRGLEQVARLRVRDRGRKWGVRAIFDQFAFVGLYVSRFHRATKRRRPLKGERYSLFCRLDDFPDTRYCRVGLG